MRAPLAIVLVVLLGCHRTPISGEGGMSPGMSDGSFTGIVVDRTNRKPINGASVALSPKGEGEGKPISAYTTAEGHFQMFRVPPGDYVLDVTARGFKADASTIHFAPRQARRLELTLAPVGSECPPLKIGNRPLPGCR
jgi:hypothetical protein